MTYQELKSMNIEELRKLNSMILETLTIKKSELAYEVKNELYIGANVSVNHPKLKGKQLRVEKINRTKAKLKVLNGGGIYNVPMSMITLNS